MSKTLVRTLSTEPSIQDILDIKNEFRSMSQGTTVHMDYKEFSDYEGSKFYILAASEKADYTSESINEVESKSRRNVKTMPYELLECLQSTLCMAGWRTSTKSASSPHIVAIKSF